MDKTKIGIIGCGNISQIYCEAPTKFPNIEVVACADLDLERARAKAAEHGIPKALSVDGILADPELEIVVNLTIPAVHAAVSRQVLEAGKHVYSENPSPSTVRMPLLCSPSPRKKVCAWVARPTRSSARACKPAAN